MEDHRTHNAQLNIHVLILQSAKMDPIIVLDSVLLLDNVPVVPQELFW